MDSFLALAGAIGTVVGVVSLALAIAQIRRMRSMHRRRQEMLLWLIDRANHAKFEQELIDDLLERNPDPLLARWMWLIHQSGSDLYTSLVDEFLAGEQKFTYEDLAKIATTNLVGGQWQYRYWLSRIALRRENRSEVAPDIPDSFPNPRIEDHTNLKQHEAEAREARVLHGPSSSESDKTGPSAVATMGGAGRPPLQSTKVTSHK
jgi:hypothetical protein